LYCKPKRATILHSYPSADIAAAPNSTKTAIVRFHNGPDEYVFVTAGKSACDVASIALERFDSEWWHGPIPTPETVLRVSLVGYERRYRVTVERVAGYRRIN